MNDERKPEPLETLPIPVGDRVHLSEYLSRFTTGVLALSRDRKQDQEQDQPYVLNPQDWNGSGTLVKFAGGKRGILTARHVLKQLHKSDGIQLPIKRTPHTWGMEMGDGLLFLSTTWDVPDGQAPDLGILVIPEWKAREIESLGEKAFYNLEKVPGTDRLPVEVSLSAPCTISGGPDEVVLRDKHSKEMRVLEQHIGAKIVRLWEDNKGYDYIDVEVDSAGSDQVPSSFEGVSGGGLWQLVQEPDQESTAVLIGVPFLQSEPVGTKRIITCHGVCSVYELAAVLPRVERRSSL